MNRLQRHFRCADGIAPNLFALTVTVAGWPLGVALMTAGTWPPRVAGLLLTSLALIWSAYYLHDFAHFAIFRSAAANRRWGTLMTWINGSCIAHFDELRKKHMRHHVERADVITFDVRAWLRQAPAPLRKAVLLLEGLYFPAVEFLMRAFVIARAWKQGGRERRRLVAVLALRAAACALLAWLAPVALLLYFAAYLAMITVLRFADCFQHTYDAYTVEGDAPLPSGMIRDRDYEQANTYSNIVGLRHAWLNLIWLNFGYHNAHHERPIEAWHRLPALHRELYGAHHAQVVTVPQLLLAYHRHRVRRVLSSDYGQVLAPDQPRRADGFFGAVGVSFLTAV